MEGRDKLDHEEREGVREGREEERRKEREIMYRRRGTRLAGRVDSDKKGRGKRREREGENEREESLSKNIALCARDDPR